MSGIIRDTPEGYDSDAPVEDPLARRLAIEQIERRRFVAGAVWFSIGMVILAAVLGAAKYHDVRGWDSLIVYPVGAALLIGAARGWFVSGNKPIRESEIWHEIKRQYGPRLRLHDLALGDDGDAAGRDDEAARPVVLLVHPDRGALGDDDVLVQDRVLDDGVTADVAPVQQHRPLHPGPAVDPDPGREHRVAD
jgi:hypothetical protein